MDLHDADRHRSAQHRLGWVLLFTAGFMAVEFAAAAWKVTSANTRFMNGKRTQNLWKLT